VIVVGFALLAFAAARCPNSCSGHGDCGVNDKCTCWANWQGFDCSERTCEYDIAWATDYRQDAHYYAECSGKGICDRATGQCVCFDGYTGSACKRSVCPNDCSGHGKCRLVSELPDANQAQSEVFDLTANHNIPTVGSAYPYTGWDGDKIQACVCDGEFFGPDCSLRRCPRGDDPLTVCPELTGASPRQVQTLVIASTPASGANALTTVATEVDGDLVLHFTDNHGEVWTTGRIADPFDDGTGVAGAAAIENALKALPNYKIPAVDVTFVADAAAAITFEVTFNNERTSGNQQLLSCDPLPLGCVTAGCSPMYRQPANFRLSTYQVTATYTEWADGDESEDPAGGDGGGANPVVATPIGWIWTAGASTANNFITSDSILDNSASGLNADQANVRVVVYRRDAATAAVAAGTTSDYYVYYFVLWDKTMTAITDVASDCGTWTNPYCAPTVVPTGFTTPGGDFTNGATGVGYNHVPIGYGLYVDLGNYNAGLSDNGIDSMTVFDFTVATVHCEITETQRADEMFEDLECSGRGTCDHSTGTCSCFEGHYGDHCSLQTILV